MTLIDAVVVGSGPNGLAAAVTLARAGFGVRVLEAQPTVGGGARTLPWDGPDVGADLLVDLCSAVHPMAWASPFLRAFDLPARGVELRTPDISYAQPLDGGRAALAFRDLGRTVEHLGADGPAWRSLLGPLAEDWDAVAALVLGDKHAFLSPRMITRAPSDLGVAARFGARFADLAAGGDLRRFRGDLAPALLAGVASHAIAPLPSAAAAGTALLLAALAHGPGGWPLPVGGSGAITTALVADLLAHGGEIETGRPVRGSGDLPPARAYVFDTAPGTVADVVGDRLGPRALRGLRRFRHGNAVAKVDLVLSGPVPWSVPDVGRAGTVHLGGTRTQVAEAEGAVARGEHAERPVVLVSDPAQLDTRREMGRLRPLWTYAHVPAGSDRDLTESVVSQIERFAPGFRDVLVASRCIPADRLSGHNANYVGGDIAAGSASLGRFLGLPGPAAGWDPYAAGAEGVYLCSASVPPGPGVHGMGGWHAARRVLLREFDVRTPPSLAP